MPALVEMHRSAGDRPAARIERPHPDVARIRGIEPDGIDGEVVGAVFGVGDGEGVGAVALDQADVGRSRRKQALDGRVGRRRLDAVRDVGERAGAGVADRRLEAQRGGGAVGPVRARAGRPAGGRAPVAAVVGVGSLLRSAVNVSETGRSAFSASSIRREAASHARLPVGRRGPAVVDDQRQRAVVGKLCCGAGSARDRQARR